MSATRPTTSPADRSGLADELRHLQHDHGYLPDAGLRELAKRVELPLARIEEFTTFFPAFNLERAKPAALEVRVCRDMACHLRGAPALIEAGQQVAAELNEAGGDVEVRGVSCLGRCDRAPVAWVERRPMPATEHAWVYELPTPDALTQLVRDLAAGRPRPEPDSDAAYEPSGSPDRQLDVYAHQGWPRDYRAARGFAELLIEKRRRAVPRPPLVSGAPMAGPALEGYIREQHPWLWRLNESRLGGMGGAGAPMYQKWLDVWGQRSPADDDAARPVLADAKPPLFDKYVVANGDESEPGTFKDREIMLRMPHLVIEGVVLAGLMAGCDSGYIFVRHEYHEQIAALRAEVRRAEGLGACGDNVFGSGRSFPVEVVESPGGYICGEQTALLEAMEGRRAQPRNRPPDITSNGYRDRPTILNNVETLAWAPMILLRGGAAYAGGGWKVPSPAPVEKPPRFGGRRMLSVSGDVARPGVYEVPIGLPLGELLNGASYCGGVTGELKAVATSGPSGGFLPAKRPLPPDFHAKFGTALAKKKARAKADADAKRAEATKAGKDYREPAEEAYSLEEWFVASHLPPGATHFELTTAPLDLKFFGMIAELVGLPVQPLLGAGIVVYAEPADMLDQALSFTRFFRNESCGKCVPCRLGCEKLVRIGESLMRGGAGELGEVRADVTDIASALTQTSICSLGTSAPTPLACALNYFPGEVPHG